MKPAAPRMLRFAAAAVLCLLQTPWVHAQAKPAADVLVFANGDQLSGKLVRAVGQTVVFKSDVVGDLTIPLSKIKEIHSGTVFVGMTKDLKKHQAQGLVSIEGPDVVITAPADGRVEAKVPSADLGFLIDKPTFDKEVMGRAGFFADWNGSATAGITLVRSTDNSTTITAGVHLIRGVPEADYLPRRTRTLLNVQESYGELTTAANPTTATAFAIAKTNIFHADSEYDKYFSSRLYSLVDVAFDHNFSQGLQLQQIYGAGVGWTPVQDSKQELDLKAELHYEKQIFNIQSSNLNLIGSTITEAYHRALPRKIVFTETADFLPAFNDETAYSANVTGALAMPVFKRLSVSVSMTDNYLNNPAPYSLANSYQFVTGITYNLR